MLWFPWLHAKENAVCYGFLGFLLRKMRCVMVSLVSCCGKFGLLWFPWLPAEENAGCYGFLGYLLKKMRGVMASLLTY